jgi:GPH family glycoside/pentoside/hexuronide:cation symporter
VADKQRRLTVRQKLGFGIFDLGGNMLFTLISFWALKYLTDTVGISANWAGAAVMVGTLWDAVTDPMMGYISDRTLTRWGRRRVYLLWGSIPMLLTMVFFFTFPGYLPAGGWRIAWAVVALMLLKTASTVINVPYSSLTPELTDDYNEQSSLNGYRFGCAVFGTIAGAAAVQPLVVAFASPGAPKPDKDPRGFALMGLVLGAVMAITTLLTFLGTKEKPHTKADLPKESFFATYKAVFKNRPYVYLLATYALHMTGITFLTSVLAYYTEYVLHRPDITNIVMAALLLTAMIFIPVSVLVSKKIGKKITYQICFIIISIACLTISIAGHLLPLGAFFALVIFAGIGVGFSYVSPFAMVPDAIAWEARRSGFKTEGAYYGMWTFFSKLGTAFAIFVTGQILAMWGFISQVGSSAQKVIQPGSVQIGVRLLIGPIPMVVLVAAIIVIAFYPLDKNLHAKTLEKHSI